MANNFKSSQRDTEILSFFHSGDTENRPLCSTCSCDNIRGISFAPANDACFAWADEHSSLRDIPKHAAFQF